MIWRCTSTGVLLAALASWMSFGVLSPAAAHEHRHHTAISVPNGNPCAGQELSWAVSVCSRQLGA